MKRKNISEVIYNKGLKKKYVAEKMGITPQYLNSLLAHPENLTVQKACNLCDILNCKIYELDFNVPNQNVFLP